MRSTAPQRRSRREGVREGAVVALATMLACAAGAAALTVPGGDDYEATAVVTGAGSVEAARSPEVARRALRAAGAQGESAAALLEHSEVERLEAGRLAFTVAADDPVAARRLAGSYARAYVDSLPERGAARAGRAGPAERGGELLPALLVGAGLGLVAGLVLALVREGLDMRRTSSRTVAARLGMKEVGRVPGAPASLEHAFHVAALEEPEGAEAATYGRVAARVAEEAERASARVLLVAGTVADDDGERLAANMAASLAAAGRKVAVVELERRRPSLRRLFALEHGPGLREVLWGEVRLEDALSSVPGVDGLTVLTAGGEPAGVRDAADSPDAVLEALAASSDLVIVCAPPLLEGEGGVLAGADGLLLAVHLHRVRHSRRPRLERLLHRLDVPLIGFVLVGADEAAARPPEPASAHGP